MTSWPYPRNHIDAFEAIESDALIVEAVASEIEGSVKALKMLQEANPRRIAQLERRVSSLRRIIKLAGYFSGRVDRLDALEQPVRRKTNYGENA